MATQIQERFAGIAQHKQAEGHQPAANSVFSEQAGGTCNRHAKGELGIFDLDSECSCRHHRRARRLAQIEQSRPLDWGDRAWFVAVGIAWVFVVFYGIAAAVRAWA
jgi:hypothetical protein